MNLFNDIKDIVLQAVATLVAAGDLPEGLAFGAIAVEPPRDPLHGDMATNAAMVLPNLQAFRRRLLLISWRCFWRKTPASAR